ncbi:hypothetical protein KCM76_15245 [Zooshikella marina]|uniref:DUF1269 domain-containing protein n=1 Tax=Zooshikella ganghwensis TaxID=202772 RepID=A0A4P9VPQ5_9GAMM|nr:hypothetical protein [Zooshikella ganghwensis]MBU2707349.1 hypothetical protein [Zooshikella ganghwensis]RDH45453.1 hypothetical protein B9G39_19470 [Zooshikella ganghwensis]
MRQLHILTNNIKTVNQLTQQLYKSGVKENNIHVVHKDHSLIQFHGLNDSSFWQELDIIHCGQRGLLIGLLVGLTAGNGLLLFFPEASEHLALIIFVIGLLTAFSTWVGGMIGAAHDNYRIAPYHHHLKKGSFLLLVDIEPNQLVTVKQIVQQQHNAQYVGSTSTISNPFNGGELVRHDF